MSETSNGDWCATCVGCGGLIQDQFILRVSPDLSWHAACLKCCECETLLDENQTCFVRDGKPFCKKDYVRLYSVRCASCGTVFTKNDFVMRAKTKMFHKECFRCSMCSRHLEPGDEFALHGTGLLCREDHELVDREDNNNINIKAEFNHHFRDSLSEGGGEEDGYRFGGRDEDVLREDLISLDVKSETETIRAESPDSSRGDSATGPERLEDSGATGNRTKSFSPSSSRGRGRGPGKGRSNRGRTVLTEKQRTILTACFQHNPKPDALLKEQLVEMTGLNARVIRVWFQNRRCKEHKRVKAAVLITRKDHQKIGYGSMNGIPMVASSPVRQDSPVESMGGVDITGFHPPWHSLPEFHVRPDSQDLQFGPQVSGFELGLDMYPPPPFPDPGFPPRSSCSLPFSVDRPPFPPDRPGIPSPFHDRMVPFPDTAPPDRGPAYQDPSLDRTPAYPEPALE